MRENRPARQDGARFPGAVAHCDHQIPPSTDYRLDVLRLMTAPIDAELRQHGQRIRVNFALRRNACATCLEPAGAFARQQRLRKLASGRVSRAEEEYAQRFGSVTDTSIIGTTARGTLTLTHRATPSGHARVPQRVAALQQATRCR